MSRYSILKALLALFALTACQTTAYPPLPTVPQVDLARFMGDWYVIANIPTFIENNAHNPVESYRLNADGSIATTFTFRKNGFDGETKIYRPTGYVIDTRSNAIWEAIRVADQIRLPHRLPERRLHPNHRRTRETRLRLDHGTHTWHSGRRL